MSVNNTALKILDQNKRVVSYIQDYEDGRVIKEINQQLVFQFDLPTEGFIDRGIVAEGYIEVPGYGSFTIKEINNNIKYDDVLGRSKSRQVIAKQTFDDFNTVHGKASFNTRTCKEMIDTILSKGSLGWRASYQDDTPPNKRTLEYGSMNTAEVIMEIAKLFRIEVVFDNLSKTVRVGKKIGNNQPVYYSDDFHIRELDIGISTVDFATRIIPLGKDGLTIGSINGGDNALRNHQYSDKTVTIVWSDERYTVVRNLFDDAKEKLEELSKPLYTYELTLEAFSKANWYDWYEVDLGDKVTIHYNEGINHREAYTDRVIKLDRDINNPLDTVLTISNKRVELDTEFEDINEDIKQQGAKVDETSEAVQNLISVTNEDASNLIKGKLRAGDMIFDIDSQSFRLGNKLTYVSGGALQVIADSISTNSLDISGTTNVGVFKQYGVTYNLANIQSTLQALAQDIGTLDTSLDSVIRRVSTLETLTNNKARVYYKPDTLPTDMKKGDLMVEKSLKTWGYDGTRWELLADIAAGGSGGSNVKNQSFSGNLDTLYDVGFYSVRNPTNRPSAASGYASVIVARSDTTLDGGGNTDSNQIYTDGTGMWVRSSTDKTNSWTSWVSVGAGGISEESYSGDLYDAYRIGKNVTISIKEGASSHSLSNTRLPEAFRPSRKRTMSVAYHNTGNSLVMWMVYIPTTGWIEIDSFTTIYNTGAGNITTNRTGGNVAKGVTFSYMI